MNPPWLLRQLVRLTRFIPSLPRASGLSNRIIKPLWSRIDQESYVLPVWDGVRMKLNPTEAVGGNLAFIPQLYDRWERAQIAQRLPPDGVFVDIGANIGAYTLWAASHVRLGGRVVAFEAEPTNFQRLQENIALNNFSGVSAVQVGVSDRRHELTLHLNTNNNAGGHTFLDGIHPTGAPTVRVPCDTLSSLLRGQKLERTDFFKLDVEGFEPRVLRKFFQDEPASSPLRPVFLLTELYETDSELWSLLPSEGYQLVDRSGHNALFSRAP